MTVSRLRSARPAARLLVLLTFIIGLSGGLATTSTAPAQALVSAATANTAVAYARSRNGAPYRYGAAGPSRFDCSGLTMWAYARARKKLPRTAAQQYAATYRVWTKFRRPGDLVFFLNSARGISHVGIYAGGNRMWHAPRTGDHVRLATIWTTAVYYHRVR